MRIDVWSDYNCPWCGIGRQRLLKAMDAYGAEETFQVVYHPYLLLPDMPVGSSEPTVQMLKHRKGMSDEQIAAIANVEALGRSEGFEDYRLVENRSGNASLAHELAAYAKTEGKGDAMNDALFRAYFERGHDIFTVDGLMELAQEQGLDVNLAYDALTSRRFQTAIRSSMAQAGALGVNGVPFYVFDGKYAVSGAQPPEMLLRVMRQIAEEKNKPVVVAGGASCSVDGCDS